MKTKLWGHAAPVVRTLTNFVAPALLVGVLLGTQAYGINYPPGVVGQLERNIDALLAKEDFDIRYENALVHTQNAIGNVINILNKKLDNTTDPNQRTVIEAQIQAKNTQYNNFQVLLNKNAVVLQNDLTVVNPAKDRALGLLGRYSSAKQVAMFVAVATHRENVYVDYIRRFLRAHPVSPTTPF